MKYLRKQNLNLGNVLDNTVLQTADGNIELNPTHRVVINGDVDILGGAVPGPEVTNVMYVTVDGNDANTGLGEGPNQAKRSIKAAVLAAQEGTTIFVRSGEYYEDNPIRLPPKVSIIGDNLRRTILRPLNGPKKFNVTSIQRTDGVVTITTDQAHEFQLHDRVRVIITDPSGAADVDDECANITEILSATSFTYKDFGANLPLTVIGTGVVEKGIDYFLCTSQSYIAQLVFRGLQAPAYCVNIDKDAIVDTSPYIQNCSNINGPWMRNGIEWLPFVTEQPDLNGTMVKGPRPLRDDEIDPLQVAQYGINERGAGGGMLIDGDRYNSESPLKSMVADAFTQVAQGCVGFHITNFGYMQLVSCFNVFCDKAYLTTKGGYLSISNSVVDFGNYGFVADGYYPIPYCTGQVITDYYSTVGSATVNNPGSGYTSSPSVTIQAPTSPGGVQATGTAFIDVFRGTVTAVSIDNPGSGYDFQPSITIGAPVTPSLSWTASTVVTTSDIVQYDIYFYQVTVAGTLGLTPPSASLAPQINGTATLQLSAATASATANLAKNTTITINDISSKPQIASIMFLGNDPIGYYITDTVFPALTFTYNETKCRRDVGYITDAVMADAVFGTDFRSIYAGLSYLRSQASKVTSLQKAETIAGINQARDYILAIPSVAGNATIAGRVTSNFAIVTNIILNGVSAASTPTLVSLAGQTAGLTEAAQILLANKTYLQDEIIAYINANFVNNLEQGFKYDEVKCARDVGIILEAVLTDLILGTNYNSKISGLSYLRSYTNEVTQYQKNQTIDGINRAKDLALQRITDLDAIEIIKTNFEIVKTIINEGTNTAAPISTYTNPIGFGSGVINSARQLEINRNFIVEEIVAYVKDNFITSNIVGYNENTCRRDTEYIVDALIFDILYFGNSATRIVAESFYDEDGNNVVGTQISEHVAAFNRLKTVVGFVIQDSTAWTKSVSNPLTQNTTLGVGTETAAAQALIDIVINSIQSGLGTIPALIVPTYTNGSLYAYYSDERARILTDKTLIQNTVIEYLNKKYLANFSYDSATCRRDIRYIVDALSYDLTYGGNTQITNAALSYAEGSVIDGEIEETKAAYEYWKSILPYVLQNQDVPNAYATGQVKSTPIGSPVPEYYPSTITQNLLQIVIDVIDHSTGYVPEPVTESRFDLANSTFNTIRLDVLDQTLDIQDSTISYLNNTYGGNIDVAVFPGIIAVPAGTEVRFHNVSTISTGGTALEYVGAGVTYNALPFFGGEPEPANERVEINNGKCFTVTNDQVGNFRVGSLFQVNALTGGVTINANELSLLGIASIGPFIRNGVPVGVELKEVSNNTNLVASNGQQDIFTVPTQYAVSEYVENRYLNKVQSGTPQTVESDVQFLQTITVDDTIITPNANNIAIGTPELGILDGAVEMVETTSLTDGVAQLNQILTLLVPLPPPNFPNSQNLTVSGLTQRIIFTAAGSQVLNGTGITAPAAGTIVYVDRDATYTTSSITATGPGNRGLLTVNRNSTAAVTKTLTYGNTTQVITTTITATTGGSNIVTFVQPSVGVLFPGYLIQLAASGEFGGLTNSAYYYITAVTATTLALSNYNFTTGAVGSAFSASSTTTGTVSFSTVSDNAAFVNNNTTLTLSNNVAYPTDTPGFHETVDLTVSGTSVPAGWNTVQVVHSQAGSTTIGSNVSNIGVWYYDNSSTVAPSFALQTFALNTQSLTYSSTIPHYNSSTVYDIGFDLTWNAGQTGHPSTASNVLTTAAVGPWTSAGNKNYTNLGYSILPTSTAVTSGSGPNATTFRVNIVTGFGAWTTTTTVPVYTADNSYTTATTSLPALNAIILYKTGTTSSTTFLDEANIFFNSSVGGSTAGATRCVNPDTGTASQDTPVFTAGSTLFNSQTGTFYDTDATVVGTGTGVNSLRHNVINYSTGYLPAGPNLSTRTASNPQYFTFRFTRTGVSKFSITYVTSTGVAAIYCAMPGTGGSSGTTSSLNKWLDLRIDNSLADGCALGGNMNPAATGTQTYNCSFGTLSSTNSTNNEIWVRIRLNQGQSITGLYLGASTV